MPFEAIAAGIFFLRIKFFAPANFAATSPPFERNYFTGSGTRSSESPLTLEWDGRVPLRLGGEYP